LLHYVWILQRPNMPFSISDIPALWRSAVICNEHSKCNHLMTRGFKRLLSTSALTCWHINSACRSWVFALLEWVVCVICLTAASGKLAIWLRLLLLLHDAKFTLGDKVFKPCVTRERRKVKGGLCYSSSGMKISTAEERMCLIVFKFGYIILSTFSHVYFVQYL